jgi:predicted DNA-binding WGR domain protein
MARFERTEGILRTFWEIVLDGRRLHTRSGRFGHEGEALLRTFEDEVAARVEHDRLISAHLKAGFEPSAGQVDPATTQLERLTVNFSGAGGAVAIAAQGERVTERRWSEERDEVEISTRGYDDAAGALDELDLRAVQHTRQGMNETGRHHDRAPRLEPTRHRSPVASDPEQEAACLAAPAGDARPWQIYADWLQGRGDARGELAALFLAGKTHEGLSLLEQQREVLLGPVARHLPLEVGDLVFRHGFLTRARLTRRHGTDTDLAALTRAFLALPLARFVTALRFGLASHDADNDWGPTVAALADAPHAGQLTGLALDDFGPEESDLASTPFGDLSGVWKALPALETFTLRSGAGGVLGTIDHPHLRSFTRESSGLSASELEAIAQARWPSLQSLEVWTGATPLGAEVTTRALRPIVEGVGLPRLRHLGLVDCELSRELIPVLAGSPLLPRLTSLDLSCGVLGDDDVPTLLRHAPRFAHLERLDLSGNLLDLRVDDVRHALPNAVLEGQRTDEGRTVAEAE